MNSVGLRSIPPEINGMGKSTGKIVPPKGIRGLYKPGDSVRRLDELFRYSPPTALIFQETPIGCG